MVLKLKVYHTVVFQGPLMLRERYGLSCPVVQVLEDRLELLNPDYFGLHSI